MITDALLAWVFSALAWCLAYLPSDSVAGLVSSGISAWATVRPIFEQADYLAPVHELLAMIVAVLGMRAAAVSWFAANYVRRAVWGR